MTTLSFAVCSTYDTQQSSCFAESFAECRPVALGKALALPSVILWHSAKRLLYRVSSSGTRQIIVYQVPLVQHSAIMFFLPF